MRVFAFIILPIMIGCGFTSGSQARPDAVFDAAYRASHRGTIQVVVPEVYEMVNVAITLTDYAKRNPGRVATGSDYYARVASHFADLRQHPFVRSLDRILERDPTLGYIRVRMNGYAFEFDPHGRVVPSRVYRRIDSDGENDLLALIPEMQSFADRSGFPAFYAANRSFYEGQIAFLRHGTNLEDMWTWLRTGFPDVSPYDGVQIVFSPLAGNVQNLATFESNGYRELQPHINFPYSVNANLSAQGGAIWRGTLLFGEMNHGFLSPTSDRFAAAIEAAIVDRAYWTTEDNAVAYPDDRSVFDEYMNFGLITLYHHDRMTPADAAWARQRIEQVMVEGRGFKRFAEFDAFLLDLYMARRADQSIADLYPQIVAWFARQRATAPTAGSSAAGVHSAV